MPTTDNRRLSSWFGRLIFRLKKINKSEEARTSSTANENDFIDGATRRRHDAWVEGVQMRDGSAAPRAGLVGFA
ncbi:MAG TPA: hypothetical protein VKV96_18325, partial [Roseiarcus sp.]|nr:hypothetical protein [Roseiarcus sp.]